MVCRWYAELLLLVVTVVHVLAQTVEYQNLGTGIQTEVEDNTQEPEVTSSSGLSYGEKLGLGISTVSVVIAAILLSIAYKRCIYDKDRRRAEIRAEQRDIERLERERREEERQRIGLTENIGLATYTDEPALTENIGLATYTDEPGLNREREEAEQDSAIAEDIPMAGIQETVVDETDTGGNQHDQNMDEDCLIVTEADIIKIVNIFSLAQLYAVYIYLGLTDTDIDDILQEDDVPKKKARKVLNHWRKTTEIHTRSMMITAIKKCQDLTASLEILSRSWTVDGRVIDQPVSDEDIENIVDTFNLINFEDVYIHLRLEHRHIEMAMQAAIKPRTKREAKQVLNLWLGRQERATKTRANMIAAIAKVRDCTAGLARLKREW